MSAEYVIDFHCDTLTEFAGYTDTGNPDTLNDPKRALSLDKIPEGTLWIQCCAIFIPDEKRGSEAVEYFEKYLRSFNRQLEKFSSRLVKAESPEDIRRARMEKKNAAILTVENGSVLAGDIKRVKTLADCGVKIMTLVWNGENEIGSGNTTDHGLSAFGREVVAEMEKNRILVDVSHLNDAGFEDLLKTAGRPFIATHSNARAVCSHKRNLPDEFIREMVKRDCFIGLNYFTEFITDGGAVKGRGDFFRHIEHFLELGAGDILGLGSDFDGADLPDFLDGPEAVCGLYEDISAKFGEETASKIYYKNAERFIGDNF